MMHERPTDGAIWREVYEQDGYGVKPLLRPGMTVLDVGAHHGSFALLCAEAGCLVHAYEPHPDNYQRMLFCSFEGTLGAWPRSSPQGSGEIRPVNCAVVGGRLAYMGKLFCHKELSCGHSMNWFGGDYEQEALVVPCIPLDAVLWQLGHVDLLKLDCEGAEYGIILESTAWDRVDRLVVEYHGHRDLDHKLSQAHALLIGFGFEVARQERSHLLDIRTYTKGV